MSCNTLGLDVLSIELDINHNILCEASAGTGKTFTIEHLFIRRLITKTTSGSCPTASQMAVLTFTKSVGNELRVRLRRALEKSIAYLQHPDMAAPAYLLAKVEQGIVKETIDLLEAARLDLEKAHIGTIHGFCLRTMTEYATDSLDKAMQRPATYVQIRELVEDYFRTSLPDSPISRAELQVLLKEYSFNFVALTDAIMKGLWENSTANALDPVGNIGVNPVLNGGELQKRLCTQHTSEMSAERLFEELEQLSYHFKGLRNKEKALKEEHLLPFKSFSTVASGTCSEEAIALAIRHPLLASKAFSEPKAKADFQESTVLAALLELEPILKQLSDPEAILQRFRRGCKQFVLSGLEAKGLFCPEALVDKMKEALADHAFKSYLKERFGCLIVDEFQDTDPNQWQIIQELFGTSWQGQLYLVGDPKQAIYAFRQADVYSYMQAKSLPDQLTGSLSCNWRSSPELVNGLNALFCGPHSEKLFYLPKLKKSLDVVALTAGKSQETAPGDGKRAVHILTAEGELKRRKRWPTTEIEERFLGFIADECISLKKLGTSFRSMAVLVSDRYQLQRVEEHLKRQGISASAYRKKSIVGSLAHLFLQRLVKALLSVRDRGKLLEVVAHAPFEYSSDECKQLQQLDFWAEHVLLLLKLKKSFDEQGLVGLFQALLASQWPPYSKTVKELLWGQKEFLRDLEGLVDIATERNESLESLLAFLQTLQSLPQSQKEQLTSRNDPDEEAVQLLTLHVSKGLEFDFVFALGLASRPRDCEDEEAQAEDIRLFYVGCTRAKKRLYLPHAIQLDVKGKIVPSPMELFLATIDDPNPVEWLQARAPDAISCTTALSKSLVYESGLKVHSPLDIPLLAYPKGHLSIESATSLREGAFERKDVKSKNVFPHGIECGLLLHKLLAEALTRRTPLSKDFLQDRLRGTVLAGFVEQTAALFERLFRHNFGPFTLGDRDPARSFAEAEFYYKEDETRIIRGFIDFAFEHKGSTYLIDWKSNLLDDYTIDHLRREVDEQGYGVQAMLYSEGWMRHIARSGQQFGGFYFVFLRAFLEDPCEGVLLYE